MTEPQGGADPKVFTTRAELHGDDWVINGEKWFSSNARYASFLIVDGGDRSRRAAVQAHVDVHRADRRSGRRASCATSASARRPTAPTPTCAISDVRVPKDHLLGPRGGGFVVAQTRLGGGRIHHAMRTIGQVPQIVRPDVRARALAHHPGRAARRQADGAGEDRGLLDRASSSSACWCCAPRGDRQVQGLQEGAQGHRRREGRDAEGVPRRRGARAAGARLARRVARRCRSPSR